MHRHAPFEPIDPNIGMWGGVADIINCAKFFENPSKGFGAVRPRKIAFPIEIVHHPYNSDICQVRTKLNGDVMSYLHRYSTILVGKLYN